MLGQLHSITYQAGSGNFGAKSFYYLQIAILPLISNAQPGITPYLVETEHLTTTHKIIMWRELSIMSWVLLNPPNHNDGPAEQQCTLYVTAFKRVLGGTTKLHEEVPTTL